MVGQRITTILAAIAFVATLGVNAAANILPINGLNTGQVSELFPSMFTPAGFTFSIWSAIYLLLLGFVILQLYWVAQRAYLQRILPWFIASCVLNASWIVAWHYLLPAVAWLLMLALLFSLIRIFQALNQHRQWTETWLEKVFVRLPFTIYLSWICVATIANTASWLHFATDWPLLQNEVAWTSAMMVVASLLALYVTHRFQAPAFAAVVIWALFGIFARHQQHPLLSVVAVVLIVLLGSVYIYTSQKVLREGLR